MISAMCGQHYCCDYGHIRKRVWPQRILLAALVSAFVSGVAGCGSDQAPLTSETSNYQVADGGAGSTPLPSTTGAGQSAGAVSNEMAPRSAVAGTPVGGERQTVPPERPSSRPPPTVNPSAPSGDGPEELLAFIAELESREPVGATRETAMHDLQQTQQQIISVAEKLLNSGPAQAVLVSAGQAKIRALGTLSQLGVEGASESLLKFCDELAQTGEAGLVDLADQGRDVDFMVRVNAFAGGQSADPQPLLVRLREMLNDPDKDPQLLTLGRQIAGLLEQREFPAEAQQVYRDTAAAFAGSQDPQVAANVALLSEEAELSATGIRQKFVAAAQRQEGAGEEFLAAAQQLLASENRGQITAQFLLDQAAFTLESNQMPQLAGQLFAAIGPAFDGHPDAELAEGVRQKVDNYSRRASLVGQPFTVEGVGLDSVPLDWSQYRGKVVLVDFWATWCGPCLQEIPNIKDNYEQYKDQGFEVVGVNLDDDARSVESFFSHQSLPWPTVVSADPDARGMQTPLAVQCGVEFIPFIVLVGRDGKVAALNVRGRQLGPKLAELLAQPATGG